MQSTMIAISLMRNEISNTANVIQHLVYCLKINFSHACVVIAARARCILFKISSPLAFQT
ncbi:hypothetical protein CFBP6411_01640 [Pseudomonas syringae group genomosp. 3]|uniref:Uncharacterized protein n=1 Tax=Pseudomonas syringae group genomosp. 3 TaxID=251701 RepID=A0A2K4WAT3_9PSED|nr:hypothetical protein CFBP6411_01640 [Pseudomonas syringae group genomosp. 3]